MVLGRISLSRSGMLLFPRRGGPSADIEHDEDKEGHKKGDEKEEVLSGTRHGGFTLANLGIER